MPTDFPSGLSDSSSVIQRVIQLTCEIEQTYGCGKSYTFGTTKLGGYSRSEWELKERQDQRWLDTAREWTKIRNPLIAEVQALVAVHRAEFTELADLVERQTWNETVVPQTAWAEIRRVALAAADQQRPGEAESKGATKKPGRPRNSKRGKAKELTKKQAAVVELVDVQNQNFPAIAGLWKKTTQSVQQLYERARKNPAYKQRSVSLKKTESLHSNTYAKGWRSRHEWRRDQHFSTSEINILEKMRALKGRVLP